MNRVFPTRSRCPRERGCKEIDDRLDQRFASPAFARAGSSRQLLRSFLRMRNFSMPSKTFLMLRSAVRRVSKRAMPPCSHFLTPSSKAEVQEPPCFCQGQALARTAATAAALQPLGSRFGGNDLTVRCGIQFQLTPPHSLRGVLYPPPIVQQILVAHAVGRRFPPIRNVR